MCCCPVATVGIDDDEAGEVDAVDRDETAEDEEG